MTDSDYIPSDEENFNDWQENFVPKMVAKALAWGIPDSEKDAVEDAGTDWGTKYAAGRDEADPTSAQRQAKNDSRRSYTALIRELVNRRIRNNPAVTNDDKTSLRLTVPDTTRTRVAVPSVGPNAKIAKIEHLVHTIRITNPETPTSQAKPEGVTRTNVYRFIGPTAPVNISQYQLIGSATKALYRSTFTEDDAGKKAWYIVQYENTRGERGPISDSVNGLIA